TRAAGGCLGPRTGPDSFTGEGPGPVGVAGAGPYQAAAGDGWAIEGGGAPGGPCGIGVCGTVPVGLGVGAGAAAGGAYAGAGPVLDAGPELAGACAEACAEYVATSVEMVSEASVLANRGRECKVPHAARRLGLAAIVICSAREGAQLRKFVAE